MAAKKASETTKDASAPAKAESKKTTPKKAEAPKVEAKKAETKKVEAKKPEPKKVEAKKAEPKKAAVTKTEVKKPVGKAKAETAAKSGTPKAAPKKAEAPKPAAADAKTKAAGATPKKASIKLNPKQTEILKKIHEAGETGYAVGQKVEERTIEVLKNHKLLKKGAKNKETGKQHYMLTKAGEKHLSTVPAGGTAASPSA